MVRSKVVSGAAINIATAITSAVQQQRARGEVLLSAQQDGRTRLRDLRQSGCMKVLFPNTGGAFQAVLLNSSGGVTGGDCLSVRAHAETGSHLTLTSQAAERIYAAQPGETGQVSTRLQIDADARLDWLPQETILFDKAALDRRLDVDMATDARFLMVETLVLGRAAMGETVQSLTLRDRVTLRRGGRLLWADATRMDHATLPDLTGAATLNGAGAMALAAYAAPDAEAHIDTLRDMASDLPLQTRMGITLARPDLLILRAVAADSYLLRKTLIPALERLRGAKLPRTWTI